MPPVATVGEARGVRVAGEVLVVPPFECAWLNSPSSAGAGCHGGFEISFEAVARSDITCVLGTTRRGRRLDHWSGRLAVDDHVSDSSQNETYVIIIGSHRNSRLCIERNGVVAHVAKGEFILPGAEVSFAKYWIGWSDDGTISVGIGGAGTRPRLVHRWQDPHPLRNVLCVGLSTWDDWNRFRNIEIHEGRVCNDVELDNECERRVTNSPMHGRTRETLTRNSNCNQSAFNRVAPAAAVAAATAARDDERRTNLTDLADVYVLRINKIRGNESNSTCVSVCASFDQPEVREDCCVVKSHAAVLAAASPALRMRLEQALRVLATPNRSHKRSASADIAAALGVTQLAVPETNKRSLQFTVTVDEGSDAEQGCATEIFSEETTEIVETLDQFASRDAQRNETNLQKRLAAPRLLNAVHETFTDVVLAVRCGTLEEAQSVVKAAGVVARVVSDCDATSEQLVRDQKNISEYVVEFHAHRVVLAARSCFFRDLFLSEMLETKTRKVDFSMGEYESVDPSALSAFLCFAYSGVFPADAPAAETLSLTLQWRAGSATRGVTKALAIAAHRDPLDAALLLALAPEFGAVDYDEENDIDETEDKNDDTFDLTPDARECVSKLFSKCISILARDGFQFVQRDNAAFSGLPVAVLSAVLARDDLCVPDEDTVVGYAAQWVQSKVRTFEETETIAAKVRWPFVSSAAAQCTLETFKGAYNVSSGEVDMAPLAVSTDGASVSLSKGVKGMTKYSLKTSTPRKSFGASCTFVRPGDSSGVFRHIGCNGGKAHFRNPMTYGVDVKASSPNCPHTNPPVTVSGAFQRVNFAGPPRRVSANETSLHSDVQNNKSKQNGAWWRFDLGQHRALRCDYYAMRMDDTVCFPQNWELQGCVDGGDVDDVDDTSVGWLTLRSHVNDCSIHKPGAWGSWPVETRNTIPPMRYLRVLSTGNTTAGAEEENTQGRFHLCSIEFYGLLVDRGR